VSRKINHIGIAVKSIDSVFDFYNKELGLEFEGYETVEEQGVKVAFFKAGESRIELLEPLNDQSPVAIFIAKKGEGMHHLALGSSDLKFDLSNLEETGVRLIDKTPRNGAHHTKIAFLHPKSTNGVLIELTQE
jgi:methylmalonyl-CoA/ethylmalonyl-CoA epimerase